MKFFIEKRRAGLLDLRVNGQPGCQAEGFEAYDLERNRKDGVEIKTGNADLTPNQATCYPACGQIKESESS